MMGNYGSGVDGYNMVAPSGVGGEQCMKVAIDEADSKAGKETEYIDTPIRVLRAQICHPPRQSSYVINYVTKNKVRIQVICFYLIDLN